MIENLEVEVQRVTDNLFSIQIFGRIMDNVTRYEEIDDYLEEFCEEWNIDSSTLQVVEY